MIPGLENAEFARYGVMHKNSYIQSPDMIDNTYRLRNEVNTINVPVYFAGQITGVEGYMESTSSGMVAGLNIAREIYKSDKIVFGQDTQIGALSHYVSSYVGKDFQPMGANFGIMNFDIESIYGKIKDKKLKKLYTAQNALNSIKKILESI